MAATNFSQQMKSILNGYSDSLCRAIGETIQEEAEAAVDELKATSPRRKKKGGRYARGWNVQTFNGRTYTEAEIHNKQYQLTHLLENGHASRNGGRVDPRVHIAPVEEEAVDNVVKKIEQLIENGGY